VALTPIDIAASYVFLASDGARGITGTFLHPDGGIDVKG
jgi:enoyl-[acyl-carrier-protein] reductase (NADH)